MVSVRWVVPILLVSMASPAVAAGQATSSAQATSTQPATTSSAPPSSVAAKSETAASSDKMTPPARPAKRAVRSTTHPPRQLHKVGDHWTAYNPPDPATFAANARSYTIVKGDTLWGLAKKFYGNAYLWPQLWESNTYITDAHWIYPGDPLLVEGEGGGPATGTAAAGGTSALTGGELVPSTDSGTGTASGMTADVASLGPPIPLANDADIFCYGYLGDPQEALPNKIHSFEDIELKFLPGAERQDNGVSTNDIIYIDGGTSTGVLAGETYMIVKPMELVRLPGTTTILGRHYDYRGQIKILCATDKQATAIVTQSCTDIQVGDRLKPMPSIPIPLARMGPMPTICDAPSGKTTGVIVKARDYEHILGEGSLIEINLGREEQIQPGDFLTVFRESPVTGTPRQLLGEIAVLTTEPHTATAKILQMRYHMQIGDRIELK
jgi:LysM repeat protein